MKDRIQVRILRKHDLYYVQYRTRWLWSYASDGGLWPVKFSSRFIGEAHAHADKVLRWVRQDVARRKARTTVVEVLP